MAQAPGADGTVEGTATTYLLIDGENIDATLGNLLDRRPDDYTRALVDYIRHP